MSNSVELSPVSENVSELFQSGYALVHLLETDLDLAHKSSHTFKMLRRINGEKIHDDCHPSTPNYKKAEGYIAMATSSIRKDYPMGLFDDFNNVGLLLDARKSDLLWMCPNINFNKILPASIGVQNSFAILEMGTLQFKEMPKGEITVDPHSIFFSIQGSAERNQVGLKALDMMWEKMKDENGIAGISRDFINYTVHKYTEGCGVLNDKTVTKPMITEHIINTKGIDNIKGIVYYKEPKDLGYKPLVWKGDEELLNAIVLKGMLKKNYGVDVPVLHYEKDLGPLRPLELQEVKLDKAKIIEAINLSSDEFRKSLFEYCSAAVGCDLKAEYKASSSHIGTGKGGRGGKGAGS